ncbi:MAG: carboxypeptidase-like regulatory domain-containing protein [Candidatus Eisenbacteria bacterium]
MSRSITGKTAKHASSQPGRGTVDSRTTVLTALLIASILAAVVLAVSCSRDTANTAPEETIVSMNGATEFPAAGVDPEGLTIAFGDHESALDASGDFTIQGNRGAPGLAVAYGQDSIPMLMGIVADPQHETEIALDASSTARALAFLCPFVCVNDPDEAGEVLSVLGTLPEIDDLQEALDAKLASDPTALAQEDAEIDELLTRVVDAYIHAYPSLVSRRYSGADEHPEAGSPANASTQAIVIDPSGTVSGHQITSLGQDDFKLTNARGRWAYCLTPQEDFYAFPNHSLLDILRGRMWAPSQRRFAIDFDELPTDTATVYVYGLGWSDEPDNLYENLSNVEKDYVLLAGGATVLFEFVPQLISVLTNTSKTFLSAEIANRNVKLVLDFLKYGKIGDRSREYIRAGNYSGLVWFLAREGVSTVVNNNEFRAAYLEAIGLSLSDKAFARLVYWVILPARVALIGDSMTSAIKTAYGFISTRFRTTFKIYHEVAEDIDVGNIQGSVHDRDTGLPIEGVTVDILGDDDNPLHPAHQDFTTSSGGYYFSNILAGAKTVRASKPGYFTATLAVTVLKDQTVTGALIELDRTSGTAAGLVVDEILQRHGAPDPRFVKPLVLQAREVGGEHRQYSYTINDGDYYISLGSGTWKLVATHGDYFADSLQVTVTQDQAVSAPRDLLMRPKGMMEGWVYLDLNNDGTYEIQESFTATLAGGRRLQPDWPCPSGMPRELLEVRGTTAGLEEVVDILIDPAVLTSRGDHDLGGAMVVGCSGYYPKAGASYSTYHYLCHNPEYGYDSPMIFAIQGLPSFAPCDCGITDYGSLTLDEYGSQPTQPIDGLLLAFLAGSNRCDCYCCDDVDGDGAADDWVVACAKARVEVHFRILVGSL